MAKKGDQDCQQEYRSPMIGERNSPENQTADKRRLDQPRDADGSLQSSVNQGGIQQWTQPHFGQRGARYSIDQGREQPQALMQQKFDTSKIKRWPQQSTPDSHSPKIRQTNPGDKLAKKRAADKRYRDKKRLKNQQTEADLEKFRSENGRLKDDNQKMKSDQEKFEAENRELKSEVEKLKAKNEQLTHECQEMKSYVVELGAENRYCSRKNNDTFSSFTQGSGPPQVSGFQEVGSSVQPSNINPFDDWSHNRDNGVDEYFTVGEIGIRSHEMLENEDMQLIRSHEMLENEDMQLIRSHAMLENEDMQLGSHATLENEHMQLMSPLFSMEGHASINMLEDCHTFPPNYIPSPVPRSHEMLENEHLQFIRSLEMLDNEDMQFMPPLLGMEGHASINMLEDCYTFSPNYIPSSMPNFDEDRSHPGKIIVRWLKIKAFILCGLSIRKKVAKRRPQIVEFEEEENGSVLFFGGGSPFFP